MTSKPAETAPRRRFALIALLFVIAATVAACAWLLWTARVDRVIDVGGDPAAPRVGAIHFGGPDLPPRQLGKLLLSKVRAAPAGSSIDIATYYFLDRELAVELMAASDRGVSVRLAVEGDPRFPGANEPVLSLLSTHGLNGGLHIRRDGNRLLNWGKLHAKIYIFSHPSPLALVGSFNPSGGPTADPAVLADIGDQDRGHNLLVEIVSPGLVEALRNQVRRLARAGAGWPRRFQLQQNQVYRHGDTELYYYPRMAPGVIGRDLQSLGKGDRVWGAVSHLDGSSVPSLAAARERGVGVDLIVHHTERRVPQAGLDELRKAGISVRRYARMDALPMHAKFLLIQDGEKRVSYFGSFNFNRASLYFNDELLIRSTDPALFAVLLTRYHQIGNDEGAFRR